jgi:shikimate kinase
VSVSREPLPAGTGRAAASDANVSLIGFMTSGKSAVGRRLAALLGWDFVDLDAAIEAEQGMPVADLFARRGEPAFRDIESAALRRALSGTGRVVATGGGSVLREANRRRLRERSRVVWLRIAPQSVFTRLGRTGLAKRPVLGGADRAELAARIERLIAERTPLYREAADRAFVVDGRRADRLAVEIAFSLGFAVSTVRSRRRGTEAPRRCR